MSRRTISNLSREIKVSRQTIYKKIKELGLRREGAELSEGDYNLLAKELARITLVNKTKPGATHDGGDVAEVTDSPEADGRNDSRGEELISEELGGDEQSTLRERLRRAKSEFDYNRGLILRFQREASEYVEGNGKTTALTHNGTEAVIPVVNSLEKYVKLNIALSKLISDLEADLDLTEAGEDDPFG